tara:strand:+ start:5488 stop:6783 length:1296 start_codon:yes stop_codon:yes gene_type:complete
MGNLSALSGSPTLVLIFIINQFLTSFGISLYPAFTIFLLYGSFYIISTLNSGRGLNSTNKNLFLLHLFLLFYGFLMFYLFEISFFDRESASWWNFNSLVKFISIIVASLAVIVTPIKQIYKSIFLIRNIAYFMVIGSILYYMLPYFGINFLSSDELAGYRYNGGINSYIVAGQFIIAGLVAHILIYQNNSLTKLFFAISFFLFAIIATQDRTSIGAMLIILAILFYRSGFGLSPFVFKIRKHIVLLFLLPAIVFVANLQYQNIVSGDIDSYKSTIHRITITLRSYELFQDVFPIGGGPGSQTFLMNEEKITADFSEEDTEDSALTAALIKEIDSFQSNVGRKAKLSPHNTYVDFLVPFGISGLLFILCVLFQQIGSVKRILILKNNPTVILDSYMISGILFFMFSSLFNLWWLYLIFYRVLISKKTSKLAV